MLAGSEVTGMGATMTGPPLTDNMWGATRGSKEKQRKGKTKSLASVRMSQQAWPSFGLLLPWLRMGVCQEKRK